jgi:hypothetical protein
MTSSILSNDKGFRQQPDVLAIETKKLIAKIKRHIKEDHCECCRAALENDY